MTAPRNDGLDGLFPLPVEKLIESRRPFDAMIGTTKRESTYEPADDEIVNATTIENLCSKIVLASKYRNPKSIVSECQRHYAHEVDQSEAARTSDFWISQAEKLQSDQQFHAPCFNEADTLRSKGSTVYLYSFDYSKEGAEKRTPFHSFDLTYLIGLHPFPFDERDKQLQHVYAPLFASFAKYGTPTTGEPSNSSYWIPLKTPNGSDYYSVDLPIGIMKPKYHVDAVMFWNYLVPALENQNDPSYYWGGGRRAANDSDPGTYSYSVVITSPGPNPECKTSFWRAAFAITLSILILTVIIALAYFCVAGRKYLKKRRRVQENESLLAFSDPNEPTSYQTF